MSEETGADIEETLSTFLELFAPHEAVFQACVEEGAQVVLSISGTTEVGVVDSPKRRIGVSMRCQIHLFPSQMQTGSHCLSIQKLSAFYRPFLQTFGPISM